MKKSSSSKKQYDKRWEKVPSFADGTVYSIFQLSIESFRDGIFRYMLMDKIRNETGYGYASDKDIKRMTGIDLEDKKNYQIGHAFDMLDSLVKAYREQENAKRFMEAIKHNLKWQKEQEEKEAIA